MKNLKDNNDDVIRYMVEILGKRYLISDKGGILRTSSGWRAVGKHENSDYRYFDKKTGEMKTGWIVDGSNSTFYLNSYTLGTIKTEDGLRLKGFRKIDGYVYFFRDGRGNYNNSGALVKAIDTPTVNISSCPGYTADKDGKIRYEGKLLTKVPSI